MCSSAVDHLALLGQTRLELCRRQPARFLLSSAFAGAYVGIAVVLVVVLGASVPEEWRRLVIAASFGIALTLVYFAGADLFTGHHLYGTLALMKGAISFPDLLRLWAFAWVGNLAGSLALVLVVSVAGPTLLDVRAVHFISSSASMKANASIAVLLAKALLCNWLVCLAMWMAARASSDTAKCIVIWWCLFAFMACGLEHSVANMTLMSLALLRAPEPSITAGTALYNLVWVSVGNLMGGAGLVAAGNWILWKPATPSQQIRSSGVQQS